MISSFYLCVCVCVQQTQQDDIPSRQTSVKYVGRKIVSNTTLYAHARRNTQTAATGHKRSDFTLAEIDKTQTDPESSNRLQRTSGPAPLHPIHRKTKKQENQYNHNGHNNQKPNR